VNVSHNSYPLSGLAELGQEFMDHGLEDLPDENGVIRCRQCPNEAFPCPRRQELEAELFNRPQSQTPPHREGRVIYRAERPSPGPSANQGGSVR
jgi:hypothetical protein